MRKYVILVASICCTLFALALCTTTFAKTEVSWTSGKSFGVKGFYGHYNSDKTACRIERCDDVLNGKTTEIIIPRYINGVPVTNIGGAYSDDVPCNLLARNEETPEALTVTKIVIPSTVKVVESRCFGNFSKVKEIVLPEGITTLKEEIFDECDSLTKIVIPKSVNKIVYNTFWSAKALSTIDVEPKNGTYCSKDGIVYNKKKTEIVAVIQCLDKVVIPKTIDVIGARMFEHNQMSSLSFEGKVTAIEFSAFGGCYNLKEVVLPKGIKKLGGYVFSAGLRKIYLPASLTSVNREGLMYNSVKLKITVDPDNPKYKSVKGNLYIKKNMELLGYTVDSKSFVIPAGTKTLGVSSIWCGLPQGEYSNIIFPKTVINLKKNWDDSVRSFTGKQKLTFCSKVPPKVQSKLNGKCTIRVPKKSLSKYKAAFKNKVVKGTKIVGY